MLEGDAGSRVLRRADAVWGVIPVAGRATRFGAAVQGPKGLLEVGGRTLVARLLDDLGDEVTDVCLVVGPDSAAAVRARLGDRRGGTPLHYAVQPRPLGVADAVARAADAVRAPFLVVMGDVFYETSLRPALAAWRGSGAEGAVLVEPPGGAGGDPVGLVRTARGRVAEIRKAPDDGAWDARVCGLMIFPEAALPAFRAVRPGPTGEAELEDVVSALLARGTEFLALPYRGWRRNVNAPEDLEAVRRRMRESGRDAP